MSPFQRCLWKRSFPACCQMRRSDRTRGSLATSPSVWSSAGTCVCRTHQWNWLSPRRVTTWTKTCFLSMGGREGWLIAVFGQLCFYTKTGHLSVKVMFCRKRKRRNRATIYPYNKSIWCPNKVCLLSIWFQGRNMEYNVFYLLSLTNFIF